MGDVTEVTRSTGLMLAWYQASIGSQLVRRGEALDIAADGCQDGQGGVVTYARELHQTWDARVLAGRTGNPLIGLVELMLEQIRLR